MKRTEPLAVERRGAPRQEPALTTLHLKGVVRNVTPVIQPGPPRYDVGVEFEEVDATAREFLARFVDSRT